MDNQKQIIRSGLFDLLIQLFLVPETVMLFSKIILPLNQTHQDESFVHKHIRSKHTWNIARDLFWGQDGLTRSSCFELCQGKTKEPNSCLGYTISTIFNVAETRCIDRLIDSKRPLIVRFSELYWYEICCVTYCPPPSHDGFYGQFSQFKHPRYFSNKMDQNTGF